MLALNLLPSSSLSPLNNSHKPFKNPCSLLPPISTLKLRNSSPNLIHFQSNPRNLSTPFTNSILPNKPRSHFLIPHCSSSTSPESLPSESNESNPKSKTLKLALVFGLWYFQNIVFNIYNKKALNIFPFPWLLASFQLFVGSIWMLSLWSFKLQTPPKITKPFILALLGPALFHTIGHISACVSFSKVAVSFTHVIKSSEPVFSVIFSTFLGESYPVSIWLSILPIVFGCSLAAVTEVSFNLQGLWGALISNVAFVLRNIYSKKSLQSFKEVDGLNMYGWISIISFFYLFPVACFVEGPQWVQGYHKAIESIGNPMTLYIWVLIAGVFYHLYNQSSYQALDEISPLTFSVGNTMKRVVVIVATVLVFRNPVRPLNALGSAIAIFGTFLYSQANAAQKAKKKLEGGSSSSSDLANSKTGKFLLFFKRLMGQILDKIQGKEWRKKKIRKITDKVFDRVQTQTGNVTLSFEELYIAVLIVYNDINKYLPGPHFDPPSKDEVRGLMEKCDINLDGGINRDEFVKFMLELTADTFSTVSQGLIISLVVAPTVALATKRATEGVPGVGKVVQKMPNSIYASLVTLAVVAIQNATQGY
uniref:EF-hand domain-containing protein n=2 Tax=Chenopodium quinoa TaxID=63459 RepID=A0A803LKL7_CHEQI